MGNSKNNITVFSSGAIRDSQDNKENYIESISWLALKRYAEYMQRKSSKYGINNWIRGIPSESYMKSCLRHIQKFLAEWQYGICDERDDHLSAALFNILGLMHELELHRYNKGRCHISEEYKKLYFNEKSRNKINK